jgi:hypothetical protein
LPASNGLGGIGGGTHTPLEGVGTSLAGALEWGAGPTARRLR